MIRKSQHVVARIFFAILLVCLTLSADCATSLAAPKLTVTANYGIVPISSGVAQELVIELADAPPTETGYETFVEFETPFGVLLSEGTPTPSNRFMLHPGEKLRLGYRWSGATPTGQPVDEIVTARIPMLNLSAQASFSVGIDLQIREIRLPREIPGGAVSRVDVVVYDAMHPDADISPILSAINVKPELVMTLLEEGPAGTQRPAGTPIVARFFGGIGASATEPTYPAGSFKMGMLAKDIEGRYLWRSIDGREPSIAPAVPGEYRINATLRADTGGPTTREFTSPPFRTTDFESTSTALPEPMASTVEIIARLNPNLKREAATQTADLVTAGKPHAAAAELGRYLRQTATPNPVQMLGRYVHAIIGGEMIVDDLAGGFIRDILKGYGQHGVLIVSKRGVKRWTARVGTEKYTLAPQGRIYEDERHIVIPFTSGTNFVVELEGSGQGATTLWKITPDGVNKKHYPQGKWNKSVTVYTSVLTPPPAKTK